MERVLKQFMEQVGYEECTPEEFVKWCEEQFKKEEDDRKNREQIRKTLTMRRVRK